jgi:predicted CopG family antitoxin
MGTTIQVSHELLKKLQNMKIHKKESYEELIWDLLEDRMELSNETKRNIAEYEKRIKAGTFKGIPLEQIKKENNL